MAKGNKHHPTRRALARTDFPSNFWSTFLSRLETHEASGCKTLKTAAKAAPKVAVTLASGERSSMHPRAAFYVHVHGTLPEGVVLRQTCTTPECVEHVGVDGQSGLFLRQEPASPETAQPDDVGRRSDDGFVRVTVAFTMDEYAAVRRMAAGYFTGKPNISGFLRQVFVEVAHERGSTPSKIERREAFNRALAAASSPGVNVAEVIAAQDAGMTLPIEDLPQPPQLPTPIGGGESPDMRPAQYPNGIRVPPPAGPPPLGAYEEPDPTTPSVPVTFDLPPMPNVGLPFLPHTWSNPPPSLPVPGAVAVVPGQRPSWLVGYGVPEAGQPLDTED